MQLAYRDAAKEITNLQFLPYQATLAAFKEETKLPEVFEAILCAHYLPTFSTGQQS